MPEVIHDTSQYANNRAEQSHELTRMLERAMRRFKSTGQALRFLGVHAKVSNSFNLGRHLVSADRLSGPQGKCVFRMGWLPEIMKPDALDLKQLTCRHPNSLVFRSISPLIVIFLIARGSLNCRDSKLSSVSCDHRLAVALVLNESTKRALVLFADNRSTVFATLLVCRHLGTLLVNLHRRSG